MSHTMLTEVSFANARAWNDVLPFETPSNAADDNYLERTESRMDLNASRLGPFLKRKPADSRALGSKKIWNKRILYAHVMIKETICGSFRVRRTQKSLHLATTENREQWAGYTRSESQTLITFRPAAWLVMLGIKYGLPVDLQKCATQGWKHTLHFFCPVRDDAPIFQFCSEGNLSAVRYLLFQGQASVRDTDTRGITPLHVRNFDIAC